MISYKTIYLSAKVIAISLIVCFVLACSSDGDLETGLTTEDIESIRELNLAYPAAWVSDPTDKESILSLFTNDAVLMPHGGDDIRQGRRDLEDNFWPQDQALS